MEIICNCNSPFTVSVVVAFFVCWAPFHGQRLLSLYKKERGRSDVEASGGGSNIRDNAVLETAVFYLSGVLYYVSSAINPILYSTMSAKFRTAFRRTLCRRFSENARRASEKQPRELRKGRNVLAFRTSRPRMRMHRAGQQLRRSSSTPHLGPPVGAVPDGRPMTQQNKHEYISLRNNYFHNSTSFNRVQGPFRTH